MDYSGKSFDQLWQIRYVYTNAFTHSTHKHHFLPHPSDPMTIRWTVFGSVQNENFDPLAFSKLRGEYAPIQPRPTTNSEYTKEEKPFESESVSWRDEVRSYPERKRSTDVAGWKVTKVGLSKSIPSSNKP
jgi:hypothetical protein